MILVQRRLLKLGLVFIVASGLSLYVHIASLKLQSVTLLTGWILFGIVVFLMMFNGIRKLPFFSIANARFWSQTHVYIGLLSIVVFVWHTGLRMPHAGLEWALMLLFSFVAISGLLGVFVYHSFPKRLTMRGEEVLFERIPELREKLRLQAEDSIKSSAQGGISQAFIDFYFAKLQPYFLGSRNFVAHLLERNSCRYELLLEMKGLARFLNDKELGSMQEMQKWICQKDDLDYHFALQSVLKYWLFIHIPLAYGLIVFILLHLVSVMALSGTSL